MSTTDVRRRSYTLGHSREEHERLRAQARSWEAATSRLLDRLDLPPAARCLDAGCGPGETMRLMAQRVGPAGSVLGIDADAALGERTLAALHAAGHHQCRFEARDLTDERPIPGGPFDLVYARLLLFHLPQRVAVLERLWDAVAPGGHLVVQDYDVRSCTVLPALESVDELTRVLVETFTERGCDVYAGARLGQLFEQAGIGRPDHTDVAGRIEPLSVGRSFLEQTYRSVLPAALDHGVTTEAGATATLAALDADARAYADRPVLWPLLIGASKRKAA